MYGQNIRHLRLSKGVKAQWVADQLGIHISTYCNIESGRGRLDLERAVKIASLLNVSIQDILKPSTSTKKTGTEASN